MRKCWLLFAFICVGIGCGGNVQGSDAHSGDIVADGIMDSRVEVSDILFDSGDAAESDEISATDSQADLIGDLPEILSDSSGVDADSNCIPACNGWVCGGDGCGGSCGECGADEWCDVGVCTNCQPVEWLVIRGGKFDMGAADLGGDAIPVHEVTIPTFEMARTEVTGCQLISCKTDGVCTSPTIVIGGSDYPMSNMTWFDADVFCHWAGGRLCTEAEWEYAAVNGEKLNPYPWGEQVPGCDLAVYGTSVGISECSCNSHACPACSKDAGKNAWGVCDLAGNVDEWVQDWYHSDYSDAPEDGSAWIVPSTDARIVRGGNFTSSYVQIRASARRPLPPGSDMDTVGARCCKNIDAE